MAGEADAAHQHSSEILLEQALCVLPHPEIKSMISCYLKFSLFAFDLGPQILLNPGGFFHIPFGSLPHNPC